MTTTMNVAFVGSILFALTSDAISYAISRAWEWLR